MSPETYGKAGWAGLAAGVVLFDILSPESLTSAHRRMREHESALIRTATVAGTIITAAHLLGVFERLHIEQYDPFYLLIDRNSHGDATQVDGCR